MNDWPGKCAGLIDPVSHSLRERIQRVRLYDSIQLLIDEPPELVKATLAPSPSPGRTLPAEPVYSVSVGLNLPELLKLVQPTTAWTHVLSTSRALPSKLIDRDRSRASHAFRTKQNRRGQRNCCQGGDSSLCHVHMTSLCLSSPVCLLQRLPGPGRTAKKDRATHAPPPRHVSGVTREGPAYGPQSFLTLRAHSICSSHAACRSTVSSPRPSGVVQGQ